MTTAPPVQQPVAVESPHVPRQVVVVSHSTLFYWWPVWAVGYVMAWGFLAGLLPAAPVAIVAAYSQRRWLSVPAEGIAFAAYFWAGGLLPGWKDQLFG